MHALYNFDALYIFDAFIIQLVWKSKGLRIARIILKNKIGELPLPDIKFQMKYSN